MSTKVRALVWEEFRVGGAIAATCVVFALLFLGELRAVLGVEAWGRNEGGLILFVVAAPALIGLLLILNPNNAGHLSGGYSRRVLWLPVPTHIAVAVSLLARTLLVFAATSILLVATRALFTEGPVLSLAFMFVVLYLVAQTADWLRAPVSGLSSFIAIAVAGALFLVFANVEEIAREFAAADASVSGAYAVMAAVLLPTAYGVSLVAVNATRVGRRVGIPELWELPGRMGIGDGATAVRAAFSSPIAAQVWFELRRKGWILPTATVGLWLLMCIPVGLYTEQDAVGIAGVLPFIALLAGAICHAGATSAIALKRPSGRAGFEYLRPMSTQDYATAKILTNLIVLIPTVFLVLALHFGLSGTGFVTKILSFAYNSGAASVREIAWVLLSRGILVALVAWPLMAVGTRLVLAFVGAGICIPVAVLIVDDIVFTRSESPDIALFLSYWIFLLAAVGIAVAAYADAWRKRLLSTRAIVLWGCVWLLSAWLLRAALPWPSSFSAAWSQLHVSLVYASLIPLPYVAFIHDIARRRHDSTPVQDAPSMSATKSAPRPLTLSTAGALVLFVAWLGWPAESPSVAYLQARGIAPSLKALNDSYASLPDSENVASDYLAAGDVARKGRYAYFQTLYPDAHGGATGVDYLRRENILIVGQAEVPDSGAIPENVWDETEKYWTAVTSHVAPALVNIAAAGSRPGRYPVDVRDGWNMNLSYLEKIGALGRELALDSLHWSVAGDTSKAVESTLAILPLQASLASEPLLISQFTRFGMARLALDGVQTLMNRAALTDGDLDRLRTALADALPPVEEGMVLEAAMKSEFAMSLAYSEMIGLPDLVDGQGRPGSLDPSARAVHPSEVASRLVFSSAGGRIVMIYYFSSTLAVDPHAVQKGAYGGLESRLIEESRFMAPFAGIYMGGMRNAYESEWNIRMRLDMAQAALGAEQFRRTNGRLPATLAELVPAYIDKVPADVNAPEGRPTPVKYVVRDGGFVIYGIGRNQKDDGGTEKSDENRKADDVAFVVAAKG